MYAIKSSDWERLKKKLSKCKCSRDWWSIIASIVAGISGSAFVSYLAMPVNDKVKGYTDLILIFVGIFTAIISFILFILSKNAKNIENYSIQEVSEIVNEIDSSMNIPNQ